MMGIDTSALYTLDDGEPFTLDAFLADNAEPGFDEEEMATMCTLAVGESMNLGGGAAAEFVLRRVR